MSNRATKHYPTQYGDNRNRGVTEDAKHYIPDRHTTHEGDGTMKDGTAITNRVYRQPWVEHDGVTDPDGSAKIG